METSDQLNELAAALAKAQAEMVPAHKDKVAKAGQFSYAYADLATVIEAAHATLAKHGLSIATSFRCEEWGMIMEMALLHASGQRIVTEYPIRPVKNDPQGVGSAISYARRYAMMSLINLPTADDDAQAAMGRNDDHPSYTQPPRKPQFDPARVPDTLRGPRSVQPARKRGRPPTQPAPVETSELYQEAMEAIRVAGSQEDLSTASQLAMGLSDDSEIRHAREAWLARRDALRAVGERSDAARDSIKANLALPKPA